MALQETQLKTREVLSGCFSQAVYSSLPAEGASEFSFLPTGPETREEDRQAGAEGKSAFTKQTPTI